MNERINELIKQSYVTVRSQNDRDVTYFSQEKFAELIVKECAGWIINNAYAMEHLGPEYFAKAMTTDFGVEE